MLICRNAEGVHGQRKVGLGQRRYSIRKKALLRKLFKWIVWHVRESMIYFVIRQSLPSLEFHGR